MRKDRRDLEIRDLKRDLKFTQNCARHFMKQLDGMPPPDVVDALRAWTGAEPSQSVLARAIDKWRDADAP